jgi:hypothetical protein
LDILKHHLTAIMQVLTSVFHLNWQGHLHRLPQQEHRAMDSPDRRFQHSIH